MATINWIKLAVYDDPDWPEITTQPPGWKDSMPPRAADVFTVLTCIFHLTNPASQHIMVSDDTRP
jgi:hypothetical protein